MKRFTLFLSLLLAGSSLTVAQIVPDRYIVELSGEPAAAYAVRLGHRAHFADAEFQVRAAAIREQHLRVQSALEGKGAEILGETQAVTNMMFVRISSDRAAELASIPEVVRVHPVRLYKLKLDHALPLLKVPDAWNQIGGQANAGVGIKV